MSRFFRIFAKEPPLGEIFVDRVSLAEGIKIATGGFKIDFKAYSPLPIQFKTITNKAKIKFMQITAENIIIVGAALLMLSVYAGKAGSRYGLPSLLLFLVVGMVAGVDGFGLQFDSPATAQFIGMISLSVILFSGGVDTNFKEIKPVLGPGIVLATLGVLLTTLITGVFIYMVFHWLAPDYAAGWIESMLLAAIMSSTDSASVFSILNSSKMRLRQNLKPMLELESGSNDPMAYLLVIMLIGILGEGSHGTALGGILGNAGIMLVTQLLIGAVVGFIAGLVAVKLANRLKVDNEFLYPVLMLSCIFFTFSIAEIAGGNSYLAVYIAGLVVGNKRMTEKRTVKKFFGGFTWLVQIIMFLSLGLLVNPHELIDVIIPASALGLFMIFVARPVSVLLSLAPFKKYDIKARLYVCWVGLRGAVPIIFATYAVVSPDVEHADFMFNVVFFITILSLLVQGTTVGLMARKLGLAESEPQQVFSDVEMPEEMDAGTIEMKVETSMLIDGDQLKLITLPQGCRVILIKREDGTYIVPEGSTKLYPGDTLLMLQQSGKPENTGNSANSYTQKGVAKAGAFYQKISSRKK